LISGLDYLQKTLIFDFVFSKKSGIFSRQFDENLLILQIENFEK